MEHYYSFVGRRQVGKAAGEALRLVTCRATRECEEAEKYELFHGKACGSFLRITDIMRPGLGQNVCGSFPFHALSAA